jgi:hypothetical protein
VCAGGAEKKTASAVYFASGQARDAISSSQERERLAVSCWSRDNERGGNERETTSQLFAAGVEDKNCAKSPRAKRKGGRDQRGLQRGALGAF